jgi:hypothetical protein
MCLSSCREVQVITVERGAFHSGCALGKARRKVYLVRRRRALVLLRRAAQDGGAWRLRCSCHLGVKKAVLDCEH